VKLKFSVQKRKIKLQLKSSLAYTGVIIENWRVKQKKINAVYNPYKKTASIDLSHYYKLLFLVGTKTTRDTYETRQFCV